jgi:hypothetical protein
MPTDAVYRQAIEAAVRQFSLGSGWSAQDGVFHVAGFTTALMKMGCDISGYYSTLRRVLESRPDVEPCPGSDGVYWRLKDKLEQACDRAR